MRGHLMAVGTILVHDGVVYLLVLDKVFKAKMNGINGLNYNDCRDTRPQGVWSQINVDTHCEERRIK